MVASVYSSPRDCPCSALYVCCNLIRFLILGELEELLVLAQVVLELVNLFLQLLDHWPRGRACMRRPQVIVLLFEAAASFFVILINLDHSLGEEPICLAILYCWQCPRCVVPAGAVVALRADWGRRERQGPLGHVVGPGLVGQCPS